jgi:Raf kinase inhibitor-like YbhB/YbcL family protein
MHMRNNVIWGGIIIVLLIIGIAYALNRASNSALSTASPSPTVSPTPQVFSLASTAFREGESIPSEFTCDARNYNPPLSFNNPPAGTRSFALTMYDPDVPTAVRPQGFFDHWAAYNISATTTQIAASSTVGIQGNNGAQKPGYTGPCPPPQYEPKEHRYIFTVYALDNELNLPSNATRQQIEAAIQGHVLGQAQLMGRYQRVSQ